MNSAARLQTSTGLDVDSFVAPFGITREAAVSASGAVVFSTPSLIPNNQQIVIAVGTQIQTPSGTVFSVIADTGEAGYNPTLNGYVIVGGTNAVQATVAALTPGSGGNVQANTITQIVSSASYPSPPGVSQVTNAQGFTNGKDQETDSALKVRFNAFMAARFATIGAIQSAVAGVQTNLTYQIGDMLDQNGNYAPNFFTVFVNVIGQNTAEQDILPVVTSAVLSGRPAGMPFSIQSPTLLPVAVTGTLTLTAGANANTVNANAQSVVQAYLNNIYLPNMVTSATVSTATTTAYYAQIMASLVNLPGVANVTNLQINNGTSDVLAPYGTQIVAGSCSFGN